MKVRGVFLYPQAGCRHPIRRCLRAGAVILTTDDYGAICRENKIQNVSTNTGMYGENKYVCQMLK